MHLVHGWLEHLQGQPETIVDREKNRPDCAHGNSP